MISIILPTYNEVENIVPLIEQILRMIREPVEVLVIDDNSPDCTWKIAQDYGSPHVRVIRRINERGLSSALLKGIQEAKGEIIGWMDADGSMPPATILDMRSHLGTYDIVIGSRYVKGGSDKRTPMRIITSKCINFLSGCFLGFDIKDYDSGFILLKKEVIDNVGFPLAGYGEYFIELLYRSKKAGYSIKEIPYQFTDRLKGQSKTAQSFFGFMRLGLGYLQKVITVRFKTRTRRKG